jgi:multidrug resistance efflux pump
MNISTNRYAAATHRLLTAGVAIGLVAGLISFVSLETPALAQATAPGVRQVRIPRALVVASEDVQIPAKAAGQIVELKVDEGDRVETGALLAVIDDELSQRRKETAEAEFEAAKAQAESDAEVRSADARARYYAEEYAVNEKLKQKEVASQSELRKIKVQWENAIADVDASRVKFNIAKLTQSVKQATLAQTAVEVKNYQVDAKLKQKGLVEVVEVMKHVGDWVQLGEPIFRLVSMEEVRVQGQLNIGDFSPEEVAGQPVQIEIARTLGGKKTLRKVPAKLDYVSSVVEADGSYRVWAKVRNVETAPNVWLLLPGTNVDMIVTCKTVAVEGTAAATR